MQARIGNPAMAVPGAMQALQRLGKAARQAGLPETTHYLVELRASQINGCAVCADMHSRELKAAVGHSHVPALTGLSVATVSLGRSAPPS